MSSRLATHDEIESFLHSILQFVDEFGESEPKKGMSAMLTWAHVQEYRNTGIPVSALVSLLKKYWEITDPQEIGEMLDCVVSA